MGFFLEITKGLRKGHNSFNIQPRPPIEVDGGEVFRKSLNDC